MIRELHLGSLAVPVDPLTDADVESFVRDGVVQLRGAFPRAVADECRRLLWEETGCSPDDPSTWTRPMIRIDGRGDPPFTAAITAPHLCAALDQLAGKARWVPRTGIGTFPIRFPHDAPPSDDGWHIESTGLGPVGTPIVDPASRERVLFLLMLFSNVGPDDAPTRIRLGSHIPAARRLFEAEEPTDFFTIAGVLDNETSHLPEVAATGEAGDAWICHPFVVHAAQRHRGTNVRFIAQPPIGATEPINPGRADRSPVEEAVRRALAETATGSPASGFLVDSPMS